MEALTTIFINRTGFGDKTTIAAIDTFLSGLRVAGLLPNFLAIYPFAGTTATMQGRNLLSSDFDLSFSGGWTHGSTGATPNGTNAYANTGIKGGDHLEQFNFHAAVYNRTNTNQSADQHLMGVTASGYGLVALDVYNTDRIAGYACGNAVAYVSGQSQFAGLLGVSRTTENNLKLFRNAATLQTSTIPLLSTDYYPEDQSIYLGALNNNGTAAYFSDKEIGFASFGDGLSAGEWITYNSLVQQLMTDMGRDGL